MRTRTETAAAAARRVAVPAMMLAALAAGCQEGAIRGEAPPSGGRERPPREVSAADTTPGELTVVLAEYAGAEAVPSARRLARDLKGQGLDGVFVIEGHEKASVCVGRYQRRDDPKARAMMARVRAIPEYPLSDAALVSVAAVSGAAAGRGVRGVTVLLGSYGGPDARERAQRLREWLRSQGIEDVFFVESPGRVSACVGRYRDGHDPRAQAMLARVHKLSRRPFAGALLMPVPEPAPRNPWPLQEAPPGEFSLHVASWEAGGRKTKAQAFARTLRDRGHEAYVYHGPRLSMVTIGTFGRDVFADPGQLGKPGVRPKITGREVLALKRVFPNMILQGEKTPLPTMLVRIPGREPRALAAGSGTEYHLTLVRWDPQRLREESSGVAHTREELRVLAASQIEQLLGHLRGERPVSVGVFAVVAENRPAAEDGAGEFVETVLLERLRDRSRWPRATVLGPADTQEVLRRAGVSYRRIARDPRQLARVPEFDVILGGTIRFVSSRGGR